MTVGAAGLRGRVAREFQLPEFLALFAAAVAMAAMGNLVRVAEFPGAAFPYVDTWKLHQFAFGYGEMGFAKRAFWGTLMGFPPEVSTDWPAVRAVSVAVFLGFAAALVAASFALPRAWRWLLVLCPAVFLQAGYDLGRIDQLNYLILLGILLSGRAWAVVFAPVMVLGHEAALVIHLPVLLAAHRAAYGPSGWAWAAAGLSVGLGAALLLFGASPSADELTRLYPGLSQAQAAMLAAPVSGHLAFVPERLAAVPASYWAGLAAAAAIAGAAAWSLWPLLPEGRLAGAPLWLFALSPLALALVGIDWPRWMALAVVNLFILAAAGRPQEAPAPGPAFALAAVAAALGPLGDFGPLPLLGLLGLVAY